MDGFLESQRDPVYGTPGVDVWVTSRYYLLDYQNDDDVPSDVRYQIPNITIFKGQTFEFYVTAFDGDD